MRVLTEFLPFTLIALVVHGLSSLAQENPRPRNNQAGDLSRAPAVGEKLPELSGYDRDGKPIELASLKGQHVVLVFGCLT